MADEGEFRENVEGIRLAIDTTIDVLHNPNAPIPDLAVAAFLQR